MHVFNQASESKQMVIPVFLSLFLLLGASCTTSPLVSDNFYDQDHDGYSVEEGDCDDFDPVVYPYAPENIDQKDNDCDGEIDEDIQGQTSTQTTGEDEDESDEESSTDKQDQENGQGNNSGKDASQNQPNPYDDTSYQGSPIDHDGDGFSMVDGDCHDGDSYIHPYAQEISCNPVDENCDGVIPFISHEIFLGDMQYGTRVDCDDYTAACGEGSQEKYAQNVTTYMDSEPIIAPEQCLFINALVDAAYPPND